MRRLLAPAFGFALLVLDARAMGAPAEPAQDEPDTPAGGTPAMSAPSNGPVGGYSFTDKPSPARRASRIARKPGAPVAQLPGFELTQDGGSRLFVVLSTAVPIEEHKTPAAISYVLKGAGVDKRNNLNALVTVHFHTPVSRARLVPRGADLHFIVDLRAASTPAWKLVAREDKTSVLQIDFPKGEFLPETAPEAPIDESAVGPSDMPAASAGPQPAAPHEAGPHQAAAHGRIGRPPPRRPAPTTTIEEERARVRRATTTPLQPNHVLLPGQQRAGESKWAKSYRLQQGVEESARRQPTAVTPPPKR